MPLHGTLKRRLNRIGLSRQKVTKKRDKDMYMLRLSVQWNNTFWAVHYLKNAMKFRILQAPLYMILIQSLSDFVCTLKGVWVTFWIWQIHLKRTLFECSAASTGKKQQLFICVVHLYALVKLPLYTTYKVLHQRKGGPCIKLTCPSSERHKCFFDWRY